MIEISVNVIFNNACMCCFVGGLMTACC